MTREIRTAAIPSLNFPPLCLGLKKARHAVIRTMAEYWLVARKCGHRRFFVLITQKNTNFQEVNGEIQSLTLCYLSCATVHVLHNNDNFLSLLLLPSSSLYFLPSFFSSCLLFPSLHPLSTSFSLYFLPSPLSPSSLYFLPSSLPPSSLPLTLFTFSLLPPLFPPSLLSLLPPFFPPSHSPPSLYFLPSSLPPPSLLPSSLPPSTLSSFTEEVRRICQKEFSNIYFLD